MISLSSELADLDTPADSDLKRRVINFLQVKQIPGALALRIDVQHGTVTIRGSLPSPEARRLCLECCLHVAGVIHLKDEATVGAHCELKRLIGRLPEVHRK
jgi:hypothetical protein